MQRTLYSLDANSDDSRVGEVLRSVGFVSDEPVREEWALLDTHDWSFWQAGLVLEQVASAGAVSCSVSQLYGGAVAGVLPAAMPAFVWQLMPSPLRERLAPIWGRRALLSQLQLKRKTECWQLCNSGDKVVAKAALYRFFSFDGEELRCWLQLVPRRGYSAELTPV
ncbi:MAG: hypothetical protein Q9M13_02505, partial [Mariprofundales bacterium]|nr:hypothetical protein [Mariprofundales bacterium]